MLLARQGATLTVMNDSRKTLLHHLVLNNKDGNNNKEIEELLTLNKELVNFSIKYTVYVGNEKQSLTPLQALIDAFERKECTLNDFKQTAMLLVAKGADPSVVGDKGTLLHCLASSNKNGCNEEEINTLLLKNKNLAKIPNEYGQTPLYVLIREQANVSPDKIQHLLSVSDITSKGNDDETLLHAACRSGNFEMVKYLLNNGLDSNSKTKSGYTAFHYISKDRNQKNEALWQLLYDKKADLNATNCFECTPLHYAVLDENVPLVTWLIKNNANLNVRGYFFGTKHQGPYETPLMMAEKYNKSTEIKDLLLNAGATVSTPEINKLFASIKRMQHYGLHLKTRGAQKGQVVMDLADKLQKEADQFFTKDYTSKDPADFTKNFTTLLNSENQVMAKYRTAWPTILKNIAIALTGIGALAITGHLIYSKATKGRALFFFQKEKTTTEEKIEDIRESQPKLK